jgi:hypothetical protein
MWKKCPRYLRTASYYKLIFPTQIFHGTAFYIFICFGALIPWALFPHSRFAFHRLILLLDFSFLCHDHPIWQHFSRQIERTGQTVSGTNVMIWETQSPTIAQKKMIKTFIKVFSFGF